MSPPLGSIKSWDFSRWAGAAATTSIRMKTRLCSGSRTRRASRSGRFSKLQSLRDALWEIAKSFFLNGQLGGGPGVVGFYEAVVRRDPIAVRYLAVAADVVTERLGGGPVNGQLFLG